MRLLYLLLRLHKHHVLLRLWHHLDWITKCSLIQGACKRLLLWLEVGVVTHAQELEILRA